MPELKKFLDEEGVKFLWSKISMEDYPNNETLIAILNAIDETKADKVDLEAEINRAQQTEIANYNESIIGLSIDGQEITYIKGDGSQHTFITQDTNTTYSLGTDEVTGLTKLYATTGSAEDGTMTQKAIKTELDKKVGVSFDSTNDMLIFTI